MARYFFHLSNGNGQTPDDEGMDLENQSAAKRIALDSIRAIIAEEARRGTIDLTGRIDVMDEMANRLLTVEFVEAFDLMMPSADARTTL